MSISGKVKKGEEKLNEMDFVHMAEKREEGSSGKGKCLSCIAWLARRIVSTRTPRVGGGEI
jgi:hypothetical protein